MKRQCIAISLLLTFMTSASVLAVGPGKNLDFDSSPQGTVIFDGLTHMNAGLKCPDCHNPEIFPAMKKGTVKMTMKDLYAGKYCGKCHDGKNGFLIKDCARCHYKAGA
jgi:c(7)-type cytochrome triheme protein